MRPHTLIAALALLLGPFCAGAQNAGALLPVRVWFEYKGTPHHPWGFQNATDVRDAVAKALRPGCKPYEFAGGASREKSHLRITLTREDSGTLSLTAELYNFKSPDEAGDVSTTLDPTDFQKQYPDGLPNFDEWPARVTAAITQVAFIRNLKKNLHDYVPFAKGVQLLKIPPPPTNPLESRLAILVPLNAGYANGGAFDVEYGSAYRLVTVAVGCRLPDNRIVVQPKNVLVPGATEELALHYSDYGEIASREAEILIYPAADFHGGSGTVECKGTDYVTPKPKAIQ